MRINFKSFSTLSLHTPTILPTNYTSTLEILMPTLPRNWKTTSHPKNYEPSSAAQEILIWPIPLLPLSHRQLYQPPTIEDVYS